MNEQDLRVVKTKKALSSSLYQLLEKRSFESLSVNEICESGMVHRTTFL
ncbi:Transcriptional regulator, TetR family (fragment) [Staphylococcus capitis]